MPGVPTMSSVSVLVPNFNRSAFLPLCLSSIRAQTFPNWHAVVGDDCSSDNSVAVVRRFGDPKISVVTRERNLGWVVNSNLLLAHATGDYVAFLHSDDWWEPTFLSTLVHLLDGTPDALIATVATRLWNGSTARLVGPHRVWPSELGFECPSRDALRILMRRNRIVTPSVIVARRRLYEQLPPFEPSMPNAADWLMWIRAAAVGSVVICPEVLANYRQHGSSMSGEAKRLNRYGKQFVNMTRILQAEWAGQGEPYPGAAGELTSMITMRLIADAVLRHEQDDRAGALELATLARDIAPSRRWRFLVAAVTRTIRHTRPGATRRARRVSARLAAAVFLKGRAGTRASRPQRHYLLGLLDDLRDDLHPPDPSDDAFLNEMRPPAFEDSAEIVG